LYWSQADQVASGLSPDYKVWHIQQDLIVVSTGSSWLVRIWCGFSEAGVDLVQCGFGVVCGADL